MKWKSKGCLMIEKALADQLRKGIELQTMSLSIRNVDRRRTKRSMPCFWVKTLKGTASSSWGVWRGRFRRGGGSSLHFFLL